METSRLAEIMELLGNQATALDAKRLDPLLRQAYPGVAPKDMPAETFKWLREGCGRPPVVCIVPPSATNLLALYCDMNESQRADVREAAKVILLSS